MDANRFPTTIQKWEQRVCFWHGWQLNDTIKIQLTANYSPISLSLYRASDGVKLITIPFSQVRMNVDIPGHFIYETSLELSAFMSGEYYFEIEAGSPVALTLISELIIFSELIENSLLLQYRHRRFYGDVVFETGFYPSMRIPGSIRYKSPSSRDTSFEDQPANLTMIKSIPFRVCELSVGSSEGVPNWMIDKINHILGCDDIKIDGIQYTKSDGAKFEEFSEADYPMRGWRIELREKLNRSSIVYENQVQQADEFSVIIVANSKGFGADTGGSNFLITDIQ